MPLVSKIYSFVSNFILSMILPSTEKGLGSYIFGHFFQKILEGLANFFYFICRWFLAFMDFLQYFIQKLIGLDYWLDSSKDGARKLSEATSEDMIFKFLYADSVQKVFRALIAVFVVLLIIFTIYAIIKSEWDYMTGDGSKGNSKASIFRSSAKAIALVIVFPILLVMGIVSSNAILASIIKAVGVDMSDTFGGKIFSVSAQSANKYRHYVDNDTYYPTSDKVTFYLDDAHRQICFGDGIDDETHVYYQDYSCNDGVVTGRKSYLSVIKNARKITIDSIFDPLVPKDITNFNGFCFRAKDKDDKKQYYFVMASSDKAEGIYYYLKCVLGAEILTKNASWASDDVGKELLKNLESNFSALYDGTYLSSVNIHQGSETVRTVCRNSWNYSLIYVNPGISLSQAISSYGTQSLADFDLGAANYSGAIMYNSQSVASYFDGGQFGNVQSKAEYSVMADVIDYMCDNNLTFYIMDATSPLIDWNYKYKDASNNDASYCVDTKWISNKLSGTVADPTNPNIGNLGKSSYNIATNQVSNVATTLKDDSKVLTFLTKYAGNYTLPAESDNDIIYTAKFNTGDELAGSRYIVCLKGSEYFYPLVNGKDFRIDNKNYCFKSVYYASEYKGVVWAKGTFDTNTVDARYGNPTYLKNTSSVDNGKDSIVTDTDGGYYYDVKENGNDLILNTYDYYTRRLDNSGVGLSSYLATYNNGSLYAEGERDLEIKTYKVNVDSTSDLQESEIVISLTSPFKSEYKLKWTGVTETVGGTKYYQFASAEKGFCYVVYVSGTSSYFKTKEVNGVLQVDTSKTYNNSSKGLYPCYLNGSASKEAKNLVLKSYTIKDYKIGDEAKSILKNTFSIFENTEDFYGTFTKSVLAQLNNLTFDVLKSTKYFDSNWGTRYYYIQNEGKMTPRPAFQTASDSETAKGIFNNTLEVKLKSAEARMLEFYENAQTSDSVSCYRYQIENYSRNTFGCYLVEINIYLWKGIFEFKTGVVQQVSDTPVVSSTFKYSGNVSGITFDYFFDQNIKLQTFYAASGINYVLLLVASVLIIKVLFSALWGVIKRFYMITLYYLAMPVAASTMPIDDGKRFGDLREKIMGEVLSTYGVLIGLNVFFVLLAPIREISSTIFTEEAIANSGSYFLKKLPITANMLNELIYILFLLVAFTLINELPGFVQGLVGKGQSLDKTGAAVKNNVKTTMKSATDMISGKSLKSGFKEAVSMAPGVIPGSQFIIDGAKKVVGAVKKGGEKFKEGVESTAGAAAGADGGGGGPSGGPGGPAGGRPAGNSRDNGKDENEEKKDGQTAEETKSPLDENPEGQSRTNIENQRTGEESQNNNRENAEEESVNASGENEVDNNGEEYQGGIGTDDEHIRLIAREELENIIKQNPDISNMSDSGSGETVKQTYNQNGQTVENEIKDGTEEQVEQKKKTLEEMQNEEIAKVSRKGLDDAEADKQKTDANAEKLKSKINNLSSDGDADKIKAELENTAAGKSALKYYDAYMAEQKEKGRTGLAVRKEALKVMSDKSQEIAEGNVDAQTKKYDKTVRNAKLKAGVKFGIQEASALPDRIANSKFGQVANGVFGFDQNSKKGALLGLAGKAGVLGAAAIATAVGGPLAGVLIAGGSFLAKKGVGLIKQYRAADDQTRAKLIKKWGGNALKVGAGFVFGGGVLGAALVGGTIFATNKLKVRKANKGQQQLAQMNPAMRQPLTAPAGSTATGAAVGAAAQTNSRNAEGDATQGAQTGVANNATQTVASAYSDNAILKNVIKNGDEAKLNEQFFENGKLTTANGKTLENLEIKNGKIMQDGKELKGKDLQTVRSAMAEKLTDNQRTTAEGKIAKRNALLGLGAKALAGVAAAVSLAIPGIGPGIALAIAGGSFLAKKGVGLVKKYRAADDKTKAQYIKKWGGNALKVAAGGVLTGGLLGAAAVGGVLFAANKLKARKASRGQLQIAQMNPAMRQPLTAPAGSTATGAAAGAAAQANSRNAEGDASQGAQTGGTGNGAQAGASAYSDNAILKNVIKNGNVDELNEQFFEDGKITTADGQTFDNLKIDKKGNVIQTINRIDENGKVTKDEQKLKGDKLEAVKSAMAGKLTDNQRTTAEGKIAKRNALLGLGAKALAGVAAAVSLAIPGVGPGIALAIAGGSFLAKKGVGLVKKYRAADDQTKAQYIKKWGGNALKVAAGGVLTGGLLGAAAVGGVLFAANKLKARKASRGQLQISQMNPAMRQPLTAPAGSTATGAAQAEAAQTNSRNAESGQDAVSEYSNSAILKNVIKNGDETKLNEQFFEDGKITTADGQTIEGLEIKNGNIMKDGKKLKGEELKSVQNAMAGKLTSAQRNSAAGKIAIKKAKNSIIAKGLIGAAAGIAMLIPGVGVLAAGGILAGSFLVKKSAGAIKRYRAANDQTKAQMIRRFGGRVMKVAAGAGIAAFTVGTLGMGGVGLAAGLGAAGVGGVMFARSRRRVRRSSAGQLQISERNPSFAQPFTAPSGTTATGAAQAEVYQASLKNDGVSEYSNNEILKNVIKSGDETKLNEQFFEDGKITTADGQTFDNLKIDKKGNVIQTINRIDENGKVTKDEQKLKGDKLKAVQNAMAGKLTSEQRNAAAGKIAIKKARNSVIAKGLIGAAAGVAMLIPNTGVLAAGGILAGSYLVKKGVGLVRKYRSADDQTKAQYIKQWGGNALKVAAGAGIAAFTAGTLGIGGVGLAAGLGAAGVGGALFVKNRKVRVAGARVGGQSYAGNQQFGGYQSYSAAPTGPSVGQVVSTEQTQQIINNAQLPANIKQMIDEAVANGLMLEGANRMAVAAQIANNQAISDSNFVTNTNDAYRNAVANLSGTTGGRVIAADVLSSFATAMGTNNLDAANYLISDEQKIAIYKSMMTSEQLDTFNQKLEENANMSIKDQLRLIENSTDRNGLGLNLGISIGAKGLGFTVNDMSVRGKGAKDDSVNAAIAQLLSHQDISSDSVVDSIVRTGYKNNTTRAIAGNYALTLNYQNETTGNITGSDYHQTVFDRAQNNADINAEAIYLYLQNNPEKLKEFKSQYRITDDTKDDVILESIKQGVKDSNSMLGQIKTQDYAKELSAVTAKHVGNGSFKVQAFDLLSKAQQMDYSAHLSANIAAISTGNPYGRTEQEQITERQLSEASFGDKELVSAFMNSSTENKDEIVNKIVAKYFNILGENGNVDINSDEAKKLIAEINSNPNSENGRLFTDLTQKALYNPEEVLVAYAKAKILGKTQEFSSASIRNNTADTVVVESIMKNTPIDLVNEISQQEKDNFAKYSKLQTQSFRSQNAFSEANFELSKLEVGLEGKTLSAKEKEKLEQAKAGVAQLELRAKSDSEKVGQAFVSLGIANNKAYIAREQQLLSELQSKVLSKDSASLEFNTELDKFINGNTEHQMFINRMFGEAGMNISQVKKTSPQYISEKLGELANRRSQELDSRTSALSQTTNKSLSNEEFVKTIMQNSNEQEKDIITNQLVLDAVGIKHENGKVNTDSVGYTAVIDEIISNEQNKAWQDKIQNIDWSSDEAVSVVVGYSKAKILGKQTDKNIDAYISGGEKGKQVNERVLENITKLGSVKSKSPEVQSIVEDYEAYGNLTDEDAQELIGAKSKQTEMYNQVKESFGYKEGGEKATNGAAEKAMKAYIDSNGQNKEILNSAGIKVDQKLLNAVNKKYFTFDETGKTQAENINITAALAEEESSKVQRLEALQKANKTKASLEKQLQAMGYTSGVQIGGVTNTTAERAIDNLKAQYLSGEKDISKLNSTAQGFTNASQVAEFLRQTVPAEQLAELKQETSQNGFATLSIAEQNALLAKLAAQDTGATRVLKNNNVDINSMDLISKFLNSPAGEALKERLISEITETLFAMNAAKLGLSDSQAYSLLQKQTTTKQSAEVYEQQQGMLISNERVKKELEQTSHSDNAEKVISTAAGKVQLLTEAEKQQAIVEGIYSYLSSKAKDQIQSVEKSGVGKEAKTEVERKQQVISSFKENNRELYREAESMTYAQAIAVANRNMIANGGLERQRSVASLIWNNDEFKGKAGALYKAENHGSELDNISEIDRNNWLFNNYSRFISSGSDILKDINKKITDMPVDFRTQASNRKVLNNLNQTEFDNIIREMKTDGEKIVSTAKQNIIAKENINGKLTEIPDVSKMSKQEAGEYSANKSMLQQYYRHNENSEEFANLFRNVTLINDGESIRRILSNNNPNASEKEIFDAKVQALKNNAEFTGRAMVSVLSSAQNQEAFTKIKDYLKSNGIDFERLSNTEKSQRIKEVLKDEKFVKGNKIDTAKLNDLFEKKIISNSRTATNYDVKMGLTQAQISAFLRSGQGEPVRERLIEVGAHRPEHMFDRRRYRQARANHVINNPVMKKIFVNTMMREFYTDAEFKKLIQRELLNQDSNLFEERFKKMTREQVNKYINDHIDELREKLGTNELLKKNKAGKFEFADTANFANYSRTIDNLEYQNPTFAGKMKDSLKGVLKKMMGVKTDKNADVDDLMRDLTSKLETDEKLQSVIKNITKTTVKQQFNNFLNGDDVRVLVETNVDKRLNDPTIANRIYSNHNAALASKISRLESQIASLRREYAASKKKK